jgi:hypothetical protein
MSCPPTFYKLVNGFNLLTEFGAYRTVTFHNKNVEIEWDPTDRKTEQCRLTVRQGLIVKGRPADWELEPGRIGPVSQVKSQCTEGKDIAKH